MVSGVVLAAGASVSPSTTKSAITTTATFGRGGMKPPSATTSPTCSRPPRLSSGMPGRRRRTQASPSIPSAPANTMQAASSIHHHSVAISRAGRLSGASADCLPPQAATTTVAAAISRPRRARTGQPYPRGGGLQRRLSGGEPRPGCPLMRRPGGDHPALLVGPGHAGHLGGGALRLVDVVEREPADHDVELPARERQRGGVALGEHDVAPAR